METLTLSESQEESKKADNSTSNALQELQKLVSTYHAKERKSLEMITLLGHSVNDLLFKVNALEKQEE